MPLSVSCSLGRGWLGLPPPDAVSEDKERVPPPKLKKEPWQWSNGTAPGEYGGPPLSLEPLKMWGKVRPHPLEDKDDFIWNIDWRPFFDDSVSDSDSDSEPSPAAEVENEASSGFISLSRVEELNRIDSDLSKELAQIKAPALSEVGRPPVSRSSPSWRFAPTRNERKQWDRARKATEMLKGKRDEDVAIASASAKERERERYMQLKSGLQLLTAGIGAAGTVCAYVAYTPAVAFSYGVGLAGSLAYVRMLGNSVDAFGSADVKGAVRGAVGQPRLLVPVILTMTFNRWNEVIVPEFGVIELQLIPMLVGFFTYKMATIAQAIQDEFPQIRQK